MAQQQAVQRTVTCGLHPTRPRLLTLRLLTLAASTQASGQILQRQQAPCSRSLPLLRSLSLHDCVPPTPAPHPPPVRARPVQAAAPAAHHLVHARHAAGPMQHVMRVALLMTRTCLFSWTAARGRVRAVSALAAHLCLHATTKQTATAAAPRTLGRDPLSLRPGVAWLLQHHTHCARCTQLHSYPRHLKCRQLLQVLKASHGV